MENKAESAKTATTRPVMHSFTDHETKSSSSLSPLKVLGLLLLVAMLGIGTGYGLSAISAKTHNPLLLKGSAEKGKTYGSGDTSTFKDTAEGTLEEGGIDGEGQYHLVRPGGDSQNVYLTSSLVDLSQFIGQKVKVWGETQQAQQAGWLMDVGKVEVE
jgi:hypothetical protein